MTPPDSHLNPSNQPGLFPVESDAFAEVMLEPEGEFTGDRLFAQKPQIYRGVVALLARGWGSQKIADTLMVSKNTVKAVRRREGATIDLVKTRLADESFDLATDAFEASKLVVEEIMNDKIRRRKLTMKDASALAVIGGIAVQNGQLLSGQPTQRVEVHEVQTPEHDDFNAYLAKLSKANPSAMGLTGGNLAQKGGGELGDAGAPGTPGTPGTADGEPATAKPVVDVQSELSREINQ